MEPLIKKEIFNETNLNLNIFKITISPNACEGLENFKII